jgi:molybdopterin/thiamine biosynthesis adenylyltransferase
MSEAAAYEALVARNHLYIPDDLQRKIRATTVLVAGCGMGSTFAEAAVRIGFETFILADGDTVSASNLNRQAYVHADIGEFKVTALARRLRAINPAVKTTEFVGWISEANVEGLVGESGLVFDTIDFLDVPAIVAVHDAANRRGKPVISAISAGWGAICCYFPPTASGVCGFRTLFGMPEQGSVADMSFREHFAGFVAGLEQAFGPKVVEAMAKAFTLMEDGTPCPAPQLSVGAYGVASLAVTIAVRALNGDPIVAAPQMLVANMEAISAGA